MIKRLNIIKNGLSRKTNFFQINYLLTKESSFKVLFFLIRPTPFDMKTILKAI